MQGIFYKNQYVVMSRILKLMILLSSLIAVPSVAQPLYVGTYNIRYQNNDDSRNGNGWTKRCPVVCDQLNFEHPDIFGTQEVLEPQLHDMLQRLDGYDYIGVGRDDGKTKGEYAAIFYDKQRLRLVENGHFWLSETPDKPSLGWDAACIRICTWGKFEVIQDNGTALHTDGTMGLQFYFFNLHMDHVGVKARREAAKLVVERIGQMAGDKLPVVLTGDFNVDQNRRQLHGRPSALCRERHVQRLPSGAKDQQSHRPCVCVAAVQRRPLRCADQHLLG